MEKMLTEGQPGDNGGRGRARPRNIKALACSPGHSAGIRRLRFVRRFVRPSSHRGGRVQFFLSEGHVGEFVLRIFDFFVCATSKI